MLYIKYFFYICRTNKQTNFKSKDMRALQILEIAEIISNLPKEEIKKEIGDILWCANLSKEDSDSIVKHIKSKKS